MQTSAWHALTVEQLLALDEELRGLLRQHHYGPRDYGRQLSTRAASGKGPSGIRISAHEARLLLRGAVPPIPPHRQLRHAHGQLHQALQAFLGRLPMLSADSTDETARDLGHQLHLALRSWIAALDWHRAARQASVRWRRPVSVAPITRLQTAPAAATDPEHHDERQLALPLAA